jgi:hypothetical protein
MQLAKIDHLLLFLSVSIWHDLSCDSKEKRELTWWAQLFCMKLCCNWDFCRKNARNNRKRIQRVH